MNIPDIVSLIVAKLRPIDILLFSKTCHAYRIYKPNWESLFSAYITKYFNINGNEFIRIMIELNLYLSGSSILQVLYDEIWMNSNYGIDIFVQNNFSITRSDYVEFEGYVRRIGYRCIIIRGANYPFYNKCEQSSCYNTKLTTLINIFKITNNLNVYDYINYYFDLSVCKNLFDGKNLYLTDLPGILHKISNINTDITRFEQSTSTNII